ncbi:MAG: hypothetical protein MUC94_17420 [bacterium]|nr:hypothetical protein [bacterium]
MEKFNTQEFDFIEYLNPGSRQVQENIKKILGASENWTAQVNCIDKIQGAFQITIQGTLKKKNELCRMHH